MRGCPRGNITSIGYLQVRYFQPGGVPVESWNSFYLLCNNLCDFSLLGGLKKRNFPSYTENMSSLSNMAPMSEHLMDSSELQTEIQFNVVLP